MVQQPVISLIPKNQPPKTGELPKTEFWITLPRQTATNFSKPSVREPNSDFHMTQGGLTHHSEESIKTLTQKTKGGFRGNQPYSPTFRVQHTSQQGAVRRNCCDNFSKQIHNKRISHDARRHHTIHQTNSPMCSLALQNTLHQTLHLIPDVKSGYHSTK